MPRRAGPPRPQAVPSSDNGPIPPRPQEADNSSRGAGRGDVHFGLRAPQGKELNWIPTSAGAGFGVLFRFYGPEKALFDKTWMLPDIEHIT
jgi:hypothetical protein